MLAEEVVGEDFLLEDFATIKFLFEISELSIAKQTLALARRSGHKCVERRASASVYDCYSLVRSRYRSASRR